MQAPLDIAEQCRQSLREHYGPRLSGLLLYGSEARGESDEDSDIDLLVLLDGPFDFFEELRAIVDVLYALQLKSDRHLSAKPASRHEFEAGTLQLYRNAKLEGVSV